MGAIPSIVWNSIKIVIKNMDLELTRNGNDLTELSTEIVELNDEMTKLVESISEVSRFHRTCSGV